jgi:glutamate N-acetyltransferase/amino-acid N-acetyltransferase
MVLEGFVTDVAHDLAAQIVADGEETTKVVRLAVRGGPSDAAAELAARAVAASVLVRSSLWGGDPNWGRIIAALGAAGIPVDATHIQIEGVTVSEGGVGVDFDPTGLRRQMAGPEITIQIALGDGEGSFELLTTDLTPAYVRFNGEVTS